MQLSKLQRGTVTYEATIPLSDLNDCVFEIEDNDDGRVWISVNGITILRFKPNGKPLEDGK